ncbi:MAG: SH3 domain-containing protein [Pedobacter sp.]
MCKKWLWKLIMLMLPVLVTACQTQVEHRDLLDLQLLPQNLTAYVVTDNAARALLPAERQKQWSDDYRRRFLAPWQATWEGRPIHELFGIREWLLNNLVFGSNYRPVPLQLRQQWLLLCAETEFPNADYPAITLRASNIRGLPTRQPAFYDFTLPGEGFPFDYLQNSSIPASVPVRVRQHSADGGWLLVETDAMFGWIPATDVAPVDEAFIRQYTTSAWSVVTQDDVLLTGDDGDVLATAALGSIWVQSMPDKVWVAMRGDNGHATLRPAAMPAGAAQPFPLPLTPGLMAELGNHLLGKPYDWGGQFGGRDCSATVRDLFACFGLYLPRNSAGQAKVGERLNLKHLPAKERERFIMSQAEPWLSLAYMPGHIMLYVGIFKDQPVFLHTLWGVKTKNRHAKAGRHLVGQTVITGLRPGDELSDLMRPEGLLLERIEGMVLLGGVAEP